MQVTIRQNKILAARLEGTLALAFLDKIRPRLRPVKAVETCKADRIWRVTRDTVVPESGLNFYLWADATTIAVRITNPDDDSTTGATPIADGEKAGASKDDLCDD